jgi:hypothetical protein
MPSLHTPLFLALSFAACSLSACSLAFLSACSRTTPSAPPPPHGLAFTTYHFDVARSGWSDAETRLGPANVGSLARRWVTGPLDDVTLSYVDTKGAPQTQTFPPRVFAAPLYLDDVALAAPPYAGVSTSVLLTATTNDWVYALAAVDTPSASGVIPAGSILWKTRVGSPAYLPTLDGGTPLGVLSTPIVDTSAQPPTIYVTAVDAKAGWQAFAIDVTRGTVLPGWPVAIDSTVVQNVNRNGSIAMMANAAVQSQRSALALSNGTLYVAFGSYYDGGIGWMVAIDVASRSISASFSGSPSNPLPTLDDPTNAASGGMWGAGGPAVASDGRVFMTTGNSPKTSLGAPGVWGNSVLAWRPGLTLDATYSPFNYCLMDAGDTDLGGSSPVVFDVDPSRTSTPHLAAFGGKQGVGYLVDRDHMGGSLTGRASCDPVVANDDPSTDHSLYGPTPLPQYAPPRPGPLSIFGPYSDVAGDNALDKAKMRSTPALFRPASGDVFVYFSGTARDPSNLASVVPPCLARLRVHLEPGAPAYLEPTPATNTTTTFKNPGAPIVTSHDGGQGALVWVLDQNAKRTDPVVPKPDYTPPGAVLYAFDATTLETRWQSAAGDLGPSGKYGHVVVAHGVVYAATDRVAAFGAP